jgi:hypothetical protein
MQVECLHFEAYVHVCTILWRVIFMELRGLTSSKVTVRLPIFLKVRVTSRVGVGVGVQVSLP